MDRSCRHCGRICYRSATTRTWTYRCLSATPRTLDDTTTTKLPARDWSKYAPPPSLPQRAGPSTASCREMDGRGPNDGARRSDDPFRNRQSAFGLGGDRRASPQRAPIYAGPERSERVTGFDGLSGRGVRRDPRQRADQGRPRPSGFGLKSPIEQEERRPWSDRRQGDAPGRRPVTRDAGFLRQKSQPQQLETSEKQRGGEVVTEPTKLVPDLLALEDEAPGSDEFRGKDRSRIFNVPPRRVAERSRRSFGEEHEEAALPARRDRAGSYEVAPDRRKREKTRLLPEKKAEKEVFIPSTVAVERLAAIFDVKLCKFALTCPIALLKPLAVNLQTRMKRLDMSEDQRRSDYCASLCEFQ